MATNIGSLYLAGYFVNTIQQEMEQDNLKLQRVYYEELERNQTEIRRFRHDMNHHLLVIRDLFDRGRQGGRPCLFSGTGIPDNAQKPVLL